MRRFCWVVSVVSPKTSKLPTMNRVSETNTLPVIFITFDPVSSMNTFEPISTVCIGFVLAIPTGPYVTKLVAVF